MAIYENWKEEQIEALKENLFTIEYCLKFDKSSDPKWLGGSQTGCLGIPAAILLCSIIDSMGSVFRGTPMQIEIDGEIHTITTTFEHFFILNHDKLFNLKLAQTTIYDFYGTYRSKLTHNNALSGNNFLSIGSSGEAIFELDSDLKITKIRLFPLFEKTNSVVDTFIHFVTNGSFSEDHKFAAKLEENAKPYFDSGKLGSADTGHTMTIL